jgi:uncharacterized protein (DUF2141 family)
MLKTIPPMETVHFDEKKIRIYFDEYVKLDKVNQQLVISPPHKYDPIITPLGTASKFITIKIQDTLDPNTTYSFNFGRSIVDNNEGNELGNFKYVLSTGDYIDSLLVSGVVTDPMIKETAKDIDVMLYEYDTAYTDSIIFKSKPRYIANTLDSTLFELTNLKAGKYLMIALKDVNKNKMFDPDVDKIGFISDTVVLPTDNTYNFTVFKEVPEFSMIKPKEVNKGHLIFGYYGNPKGVEIEVTSDVPDDFTYKLTFEKEKDTINYWYTPFEADSLNFRIQKDDYVEEVTTRIRSSEIDSLTIRQSTSSVLHLLDTFYVQANVPVVAIDTSKFSLTDKDTLAVKYEAFIAEAQSRVYFNFDKTHDNSYQIKMLPGLVTDIFGLTNDSIEVNINTKIPEDYGVLNMQVNGPQSSGYIVELLTGKEELVRTIVLDSPGMATFELLNPGIYLIRVTSDRNKNGKWDTGNFLMKKLPEETKYFEDEIEIRANWEKNEVFRFD